MKILPHNSKFSLGSDGNFAKEDFIFWKKFLIFSRNFGLDIIEEEKERE